jgi:molybdate-binding protein/DNA-binding transcriptional regulator YhcF (GntR family)
MDEPFLYKRIAEEIRQEILSGTLQPGERLPSIRKLTSRWNCTAGTIQRAFAELAQQELIVSRAGQGTHVAGKVDTQQFSTRSPLRRANMVHRAEAFLLESVTSGYGLDEIQQALHLAMDRWRILQEEPKPTVEAGLIRFAGSHDMAVVEIAARLPQIMPELQLQLSFSGSLGGLMDLAGGRCDIAGCHLWDAATDSYNEPFIRKLFPGQEMALLRLANRRSGLIVSPGNPHRLNKLEDLVQPGVRFVNRQAGSGTRVWLDETLLKKKMDPHQIVGYEDEKVTHSEVARAVAEGRADVGIGLESAAAAFSLDFVLLMDECYDLVTYTRLAKQNPLRALMDWLATDDGRQSISSLAGYDVSETGRIKYLRV